MKFPKQKGVFYLRHMLLNYAKLSFEDCKMHNQKTYSTYEEAMIATGYFAAADEPTRVLTELVQLRYTAAHLRFAFLALLEQDASPITLYKKFEKELVADFFDRGQSILAARRSVQTILHLSCQSVGKSLDLGAQEVTIAQELLRDDVPSTLTTREATQKAKILFKSICKDAGQTKAVTDITAAVRAGAQEFFFVHGPAGSGKSTMGKYITYSTLASNKDILNMATTEQAALQLPFGVSAHSMCKIPISDEDVLCCTLPMNSQHALQIANASVIQWDEWPNVKRSAWDSVVELLERLKQHHPRIWVPKVKANANTPAIGGLDLHASVNRKGPHRRFEWNASS